MKTLRRSSTDKFRHFVNNVFYIGKGVGTRPYEHTRIAEKQIREGLTPIDVKVRFPIY